MYDFNKSKDGIERCTLTMRVRLTLEEIATLVTAYQGDDFQTGPFGEKEVSRKAIKKCLPSKRAVMEIVRMEIVQDGMDRPPYMVGDDGLSDVCEAVLDHLKWLWADEKGMA